MVMAMTNRPSGGSTGGDPSNAMSSSDLHPFPAYHIACDTKTVGLANVASFATTRLGASGDVVEARDMKGVMHTEYKSAGR
jgi:hypothetical protein